MKRPILLISVQDNLSVMGLRYIHHILLDNGYPSNILHLAHPGCPESVFKDNLCGLIGRTDPLFIGMSLMSVQYERARGLSAFLKGRFPSIPIVWGGVHPTIDPESCLEFADYACVGEGEISVLKLADAIKSGRGASEVPNVCCRASGTIRKNRVAPLVEKLDGLPRLNFISPNSFIQTSDGGIVRLDKDIFKRNARYRGRMYEILTSRGCAFACSYCCNNFFTKLYGTRTIRRRSVGDIIGELEDAVSDNPEISMVHIQDDSFMSCDEGYLEDFCAAYKDKVGRPLTVHAIPVYVNRDKLALLKDAGLAWINMGLQSGSDRVLHGLYRRPSGAQDFLRAAMLVNEVRVAGKYDVILDNPLETREEKIKTVEVLAETPKPFLLELYSLTLYPGTELYAQAQAQCPAGIEDYRTKDYLKCRDSDLNGLTAIAVYLPGRFLRNVVKRYKENPHGLSFKVALAIGRIASALCYRPLALMRMLMLSNGDSLIRSLTSIPIYAGEMQKKKF